MTEGTPELERTLVHHLSRTRFEDLPHASVEAARRCVLDAAAVCVAGSTGQDIDKLLRWLESQSGPAEAGVLVYGARLPAYHATWINSAMARAHEFDDSHDPTGDHTSVPIFSAALAAAEICGGVSGREFLTAYVLAADLVSRLRLAPTRKVGGTDFAANTYAPFAAATAAGWLLGLRDDGLYAALGWASAQAAGSLQLQQGGTSTLHVHHGLAAATGVQGALLARQRMPGMEHFLTGSFGFYHAYERGDYADNVITDELGKRFEIEQVSVKQYPSGRVTHGPIQAAIALRETHGFRSEDVEEVVVTYTPGGYRMTCLPEAERRNPTNVQHAKFSLFYTVACALARGHVDLSDFTLSAVADEVVQWLAARVRVEVDRSLGQVIPPGIVRVRLRDGRELAMRVEHLRGSPEDPVTFADCAAKLRLCAAHAARPLAADRVEAVVELVASLEQQDDIRPFAGLLAASAV
jgi:2-methylcitrate dehydratase PrpD